MNGRKQIWLAEDEAAIADSLIYSLETEGFNVRWFDRAQPLLSALNTEQPDFLILDIGLPDMSGFELCRQIRQHYNIPLMFLTARSEEIDRLLGLEIGADDYVAKPFSPREVCARVRVILRRSQPQNHNPTTEKGLMLDEQRARITLHGQPLNLTRYEYLFLKILIAAPGRVYSRATIMNLVWENAEDTTDRTVDTHVKTIRAKLKDIDPDSNYILTHRGLGYSLEGV